MKIIGKTDSGYLVETTEREMAIACGFSWETDKLWHDHTRNARQRKDPSSSLMLGGEIEIRAAHEYLEKLRNRETTVKTAAKVLRELAEMMEAGVPTAIVPPPEQGSSGGD